MPPSNIGFIYDLRVARLIILLISAVVVESREERFPKKFIVHCAVSRMPTSLALAKTLQEKAFGSLTYGTPDRLFLQSYSNSQAYFIENHAFEAAENENNEMAESVVASQEEAFQVATITAVENIDVERTTRSTQPTEAGIASESPNTTPESVHREATIGEALVTDIETQAKQVRARERVEIRRGRVYRTRRMVHDCREQVRQLREAVRDSSGQLMKKIDEAVTLENAESLKALLPYYYAVRNAQDDLGPIEDDYDRLERRLDNEEQDLELEENYFYRRYAVPTIDIPDEDAVLDEALSPFLHPQEPPESDFDVSDHTDERVEKYLEKVAVAKRLKKELIRLEEKHTRLTEEEEFRSTHDIPLSNDAKGFLADFYELHRGSLKRLHLLEDEIFQLRDQCLEKGLFTESEHGYEPRDAFSDDLMDLVSGTEERSPLAAAIHEIDSDDPNEKTFEDKRKYINQWLLEWVQHSTVDTLQLRAFVYFECAGVDEQTVEEQWPTLAVALWNDDLAGENTNKDYALSRMDAIDGGTAMPTNSSSLFGSGRRLSSLETEFVKGDRQQATLPGEDLRFDIAIG